MLSTTVSECALTENDYESSHYVLMPLEREGGNDFVTTVHKRLYLKFEKGVKVT